MEVTRKEAILQKCWDCMGQYGDGKGDCGVKTCPLYSFMPYRDGEPDLELFKYSPKHIGKVLREDTKREFSEEHLETLRNRFKKK